MQQATTISIVQLTYRPRNPSTEGFFNAIINSMSVSHLFSIPILETEVDLNQIILGDGDEYYNGEVNWTYGKQQCPESTYNYLYSIISPFLLEYDPYINFQFTDIWRNRYVATDYQGYHIHAQSQWSFIIYETVDSKTCLLYTSPSPRDS